MNIENLRDLLHHEMKDLWSAENQIIDALPAMVKAASDQGLRRALEDHLKVTKKQQSRVEKICDELDWGPRGHKCAGMEGLIKEGKDLLKEDLPEDVLDAAIIGAAQRVEHYEMAAYGTARNHAREIGLDDVADRLQEILDEEGEADKLLTELANKRINREARV
ncbi:MAG: ferritin-like domain-containing protein [Gemmatimonadota bacterium]